jgi:hypothetical protein
MKLTQRLRRVATDLCNDLKRPVSIREISTIITKKCPDMAIQIQRRSVDYVRVTITTSPPGQFVKYRAGPGLRLPRSETSQKLFWGISGHTYGPNWILVDEQMHAPRQSSHESSPASTPLIDLPEPSDDPPLAAPEPAAEAIDWGWPPDADWATEQLPDFTIPHDTDTSAPVERLEESEDLRWGIDLLYRDVGPIFGFTDAYEPCDWFQW